MRTNGTGLLRPDQLTIAVRPQQLQLIQACIGLPHFPQNRVPAGYAVLQSLQNTSTLRGLFQLSAAVPNGIPHLPQNLVPGAYRVWHWGQITSAGADD